VPEVTVQMDALVLLALAGCVMVDVTVTAAGTEGVAELVSFDA